MSDLGQIFTKKVVADYMVSLFDLPKDATIMEPCCGKGAFLDALISHNFINITACELDKTLFEITKNKYSQYKILNINFLNYNSKLKYDGIIMNPPYIRHEKINRLASYGITKEELHCIPLYVDLPRTANIYMYFIVKAIDLLNENGQLIVIFPNSWINTKTGQNFQKLILLKCRIEKEIHISGDIFEKNALVEVVILKLIKNKINFITSTEFLESKNGKLISNSIKERKVFNIFSYPFSKLATIKRGLTTGYNKMYINPSISCEDNDCFKQIISSPKNIHGYTTLNAHLDRLFFPIDGKISKEISEYLEFWKNKIIEEKNPKTLYLKINSNKKWYKIQEICSDDILFAYFVRNDMKFVMNEGNAFVRDNFYILKSKIDKFILFALLNNYYTYYQLELNGKRHGAGLLKLQKYDLEKLTFPDYNLISESDKIEMKELSYKLLNTSNSSYILKITKVLSKYSSIDYDEISKKYFSIKRNRLEVN